MARPMTGPLLLAAGELVWQLVPVLIEPQRVKQLVDIQRTVAQISAHLNIFPYIQVGDQIVHLEDIALSALRRYSVSAFSFISSIFSPSMLI